MKKKSRIKDKNSEKLQNENLKSNTNNFKIKILNENYNLEIYFKDFPKKLNYKKALEACNKLGDEWRLPTVEEYGLIHDKLYSKSKGSFKDDLYWSSSKTYTGIPYYFDFNENCHDCRGISIEDNFYVRAVKNI